MLSKISIITVCYNSAKTIEQTILSVLSQDYPNIEYIIVDGASGDGTLQIIKKYQHKIAMVVSEKDNGIYDAMNKGIALASGDIIGLLNADDLYAHNQVISLVAQAMTPDAIDACFGDLIYFSPSTNKLLRYWESSEFKSGLFAKGWCPPHPTFFVKRNVYLKHGLFNTAYKMGNDVELMMRFLEKAKIKSVYLPHVLVHMRAGGVSNRGFKNIIIQNKSVMAAARALDIPFSYFGFVVGKLSNRLLQFIVKPKRSDYVK